MFRRSLKIKNRIYCVLFTALLTAGKVFAEDDPADLDPDGNFTVVAVLRYLWDLLNGMMA